MAPINYPTIQNITGKNWHPRITLVILLLFVFSCVSYQKIQRALCVVFVTSYQCSTNCYEWKLQKSDLFATLYQLLCDMLRSKLVCNICLRPIFTWVQQVDNIILDINKLRHHQVIYGLHAFINRAAFLVHRAVLNDFC